jgi:sphingolipid 8-(E)-desaturase
MSTRRYHSSKVLQQMRGYRIGVIDEPWIDFEPPISGGTFNLGDQEDIIQSLPKSNVMESEIASLPAEVSRKG